MRRKFIEKVKKLIRDWAKQYPQIVLPVVEVYPSGIFQGILGVNLTLTGFGTLSGLKNLSSLPPRQAPAPVRLLASLR
jgi:Na+/serine symporter